MIITESQKETLSNIHKAIMYQRGGRRTTGRIPNNLREKIINLIHSGVDPHFAAHTLGITSESIKRWMNDDDRKPSSPVPIEPSPAVFTIKDDRVRQTAILQISVSDFIISVNRIEEI